jgi:hypothetical protein
MKNTVKVLLFLVIIIAICMPMVSFAQGGPGFGGGVDDGGVCVPLDGGLSMLIAAGAGIGIKKLHAKRKLRTLEK